MMIFRHRTITDMQEVAGSQEMEDLLEVLSHSIGCILIWTLKFTNLRKKHTVQSCGLLKHSPMPLHGYIFLRCLLWLFIFLLFPF